MRLLLVRHGESVDNVAGLYAGSRDSSLTAHGVLQAKRLGAHVAGRRDAIGPIRHLFASNLQRAYQTAEAIAEACRPQYALDVVRVEDLREKDFGSSEGKKFGATEVDDAESSESMRRRIDRFLERHLSPLIDELAAENVAIAVVSHGIILNILLKALLARYPPKATASIAPDERRRSDHLYPWNNTGVLQANLEPSESNAESQPAMVSFTVEHVNNIDHLQGLKKTRGGIGSAPFDSRQRTMDSFFASSSKRKFDDANG